MSYAHVHTPTHTHTVAYQPLAGSRSLRLLPSGDGWSLVSLNGNLVYSAPGISGRRRCLEFARAEGVITLTSR